MQFDLLLTVWSWSSWLESSRKYRKIHSVALLQWHDSVHPNQCLDHPTHPWHTGSVPEYTITHHPSSRYMGKYINRLHVVVCGWWSVTSAVVRSTGWPVAKVWSAITSPFIKDSTSQCLRVWPVRPRYTLGYPDQHSYAIQVNSFTLPTSLLHYYLKKNSTEDWEYSNHSHPIVRRLGAC